MKEFIDLKIRKFQEFLINYINSVDEIPIEVKRLAILEILHELETESIRIINTQQRELKQRNEVGKDAESV